MILRIILLVIATMFTVASGYHMIKNRYVWEVHYAYSLTCALGILMLMIIWTSE